MAKLQLGQIKKILYIGEPNGLENKQELVFRKGQELIRMLIKDIIYIEAEKNYLMIRICDEMIRIREAMKKRYGKRFLRCF